MRIQQAGYENMVCQMLCYILGAVFRMDIDEQREPSSVFWFKMFWCDQLWLAIITEWNIEGELLVVLFCGNGFYQCVTDVKDD